ncbi:MAG: hypothetical protein QM757_28525 [Paludibaculum sp.]
MIQLATGGDRVAALQFDLTYEVALGMSARAGAVATGAGKSLYASEVAPGRLRVLVVGQNSSLLDDGELVSLSLSVASSTISTGSVLGFENAIASDPAGQRVGVTSTGGTVMPWTSTNLPTVGVFPHLAAGGGWKTSFTLLNLASAPSLARLNFWDDQGAPRVLQLAFPPDQGLAPQTASALDVTIPAQGVVVVETDTALDSAVRVGSAELQAPSGVFGSATFSYQQGTGQSMEAVIPLETRQATSLVQPFDNTPGYVSAVAVANSSALAPASVQVIARDRLGNQLFADTILLPAHGHSSFSLVDRYAGLGGQRGTLEFVGSNGGAIAVLGLRFNENGVFTSVPAQAR